MATGTPCFKVVLCGEYGVGKSSLFRRFMDNSFTDNTGPRSSMGLDHFSKEYTIRGRKTKIDLWDTAGIERFATLSSSYFQGAIGAILCYSTENRDSFNMLSQHILEIVVHSSTAKIFLCGNKSDIDAPSSEKITASDISEFQHQCDAVLSGTYQVSCFSGEGVKEMFEDIAIVLQREAIHKFDPTRIQAHHPHLDEEGANKDEKCQC